MKYDLLTYYPLIEKVHINCLYYTFWLKNKIFYHIKLIYLIVWLIIQFLRSLMKNCNI